jgi:hypothetical protein
VSFAFSQENKTPEHKLAVKHGDIEFHDLTGPVLDAIANEGLRIARGNSWKGIIIEIAMSGLRHGTGSTNVRCTLRNATCTAEVDEPSAAMLDAARRLQELFMSVGTPLAGATIDWISSGDNDGTVRRRCRYRYD